MSAIETLDKAVTELVDSLVQEYKQTGFLSAPSDERKTQIIDEIAKLRASMTPKCDCKKD